MPERESDPGRILAQWKHFIDTALRASKEGNFDVHRQSCQHAVDLIEGLSESTKRDLVPAFCGLLRDQNLALREQAAWQLLRLAVLAEEAVRPLQDCMKDRMDSVSHIALFALSKIATPDALKAVTKFSSEWTRGVVSNIQMLEASQSREPGTPEVSADAKAVLGRTRADVRRWYFKEEPKGTIFDELLRQALHYCSTVQWIIRSPSNVGKQERFLATFEPFFLRHFKWAELPGYFDIRLQVPDQFGLYHYHYNETFKATVLGETNHFFGLGAENFALLRGINVFDEWLGSHGRDRLIWLSLTDDERSALRASAPAIAEILTAQPSHLF